MPAQEIFGPVTGVTTFKTEEEAIEMANDTIYGLGTPRAFTDRQIARTHTRVDCHTDIGTATKT